MRIHDQDTPYTTENRKDSERLGTSITEPNIIPQWETKAFYLTEDTEEEQTCC